MLNPKGVGTWIDPAADRPLEERDSTNCGHCDRVIFVKAGTVATIYLITHRDGRVTEEPGAFCRCCMRPVCLRCHEIGSCTPFERWLEAKERVSGASLSSLD